MTMGGRERMDGDRRRQGGPRCKDVGRGTRRRRLKASSETPWRGRGTGYESTRELSLYSPTTRSFVKSTPSEAMCVSERGGMVKHENSGQSRSAAPSNDDADTGADALVILTLRAPVFLPFFF